ncbi:FAD:protein FMN transferase [Caulobacter segnis]|uniref:FAD:protein FMN transferase n=1 Tax=Caulobacter segnis TaxID=88688 RepID=UPI00240FAD37|nr:FAD:protein FMN transferase [Caulobacter segnis]MDG2523070.1 FAD:protein FMN transferase [Caulobacter segnis]
MNRVLVPHIAVAPERPAGSLLSLGGETMGTTWSVKFVDNGVASRADVDAVITERLDQVITEMSTWDHGSLVSRFNVAESGSWHDMPTAFAKVLACALDVAEASDGAFDPTVGGAVDLWGFGPKVVKEALPSPAESQEAAASIGWRRVVVDALGRLQQPGGLRLDFSGIAKGFAVDHIADGLKDLGAPSALIEIGGELYGYGVKPDAQPWWIELENAPEVEGGRFVVAACGLAAATSGDWRRRFRHAGAWYGHTLDPRTGRPVIDPAASVTVLHSSCMRADAEATAITVLGVQAGLDYAERRGLAAVIVSRSSTGYDEHMTSAFAAMLEDE